MLGWAETYREGYWLPILSVLANTGARIGQVCGLDGRDVDRKGCRLFVRHALKGRDPRWIAVDPDTMELLGEVGDEEPLFIGSRTKQRCTRDSVRWVLYKGLEAVGVKDPERLDMHSFRRSFNVATHRAGVPDDVGRRQTGQTLPVYQAYMVNAEGDDLHAVVDQAKRWRQSQAARARSVNSVEPSVNSGNGLQSHGTGVSSASNGSRRTPWCSPAPRAGR